MCNPSTDVARTDPFRKHTDRYEAWFDTYEAAYQSEVDALESLRPPAGPAVEIGVGTGRFAQSLDVGYGLDPAPEMLAHATERGIAVVRGVAGAVPFGTGAFELVLVVTTICFVEDVTAMLEEAGRVLRPGGHVLLGYIDAESPVGQQYQNLQDENPFYRDATFRSTEGVLEALEAAGFTDVEVRQTVFTMPDEMTAADPVRDGYGEGSFVALRATWPGSG